ncbi:TPA: hypothetical protein H7V34_004996, partial [Escherichia coli]|nr:hypothetical protein [Escherichia coli]
MKRNTIPLSILAALISGSAQSTSFNTDFFKISDGDSSEALDLSYFNNPGGVFPGVYNVNVFVNGVKVSTNKDITFCENKDVSEHVFPCLDASSLSLWGVKVDTKYMASKPIEKNIPGSSAVYQTKGNVLDINVPQAFMNNAPWFKESPSSWDDGVTSLLFNYNLSGISQKIH